MKFLPSSWLYPGTEQRQLVVFDDITTSESLLHSVLHAISPNYRSRKTDIDKHLYVTRFKSALMKEIKSCTLESISKAFEINIYVFKPVIDDTVIVESHHLNDDFPYIFIGVDEENYKPMGIHMNRRVHLVFYESHDDEIIRSLVSYDKSGLSNDYKTETKQFMFKNTYLKYDVKKVLKKVTTKK